jgi:hypothetical protein
MYKQTSKTRDRRIKQRDMVLILFIEVPVFLRIYGKLNLTIILYGNTELSIDQKKDIFRAVQVFLKDSKIFG